MSISMRRHRIRHLPAYVALLLPLGALTWLGSAELGARQDRAERALHDHATGFLRDARLRLDRAVTALCSGALDVDVTAGDANLVRLTRTLVERDSRLLTLFVLAADGTPLFPRPSPTDSIPLPFHESPEDPAVARAEVLEAKGDGDGARRELEQFLTADGDGEPRRREDDLRAHFALGGLLRRAGDLAAAEDHYLAALANLSGRPRGRDVGETAAVNLLCEIALAELDAERTGSLDSVVAVIENVAEGVHDAVPDALLVTVVDRLRGRAATAESARGQLDDALQTERVRLDGRTFIAEYESFLSQSIRRRLRLSDPGGDGFVYQVHRTPTDASLLALRRVRDDERFALPWPPEPEWIGVRIDLDLAIADALGAAFDSDSIFGLAILDSDGLPITPGSAHADGDHDSGDLGELPIVHSELGLQLHAIPVDAARYIAERERSLHNQGWLVVATGLVAAAGAFLLVRSVHRETELADLKVELLSRVSHELKTPIALIRMYGETIGMGRAATPEQTARFAGIITREADQLTRMIDRVLEFSRRDAGARRNNAADTELAPLLAKIAGDCEPLAAARGLTLRTDLAPRLVVHVDPDGLTGAIANLLENAVKYTPRDSGREIELAAAGADGHAVVEVRDRGIGIPAGEFEQVFDGFYRASNAGEARGAGLGLSLVRAFALDHGGAVSAYPRDGGGTTMRLTLPLIARDTKARETERT